MYPAPAAQAPYAQPYANGYAAAPVPAVYGQPPYQPVPTPTYGAHPYQQPYTAPSQTGPPYKKQKGNPVITRYPPPPGYRPPHSYAATHVVPAHSAQPEYQPPQPSYPHPPYQGYQQPPVTAYPTAAPYPAHPVYDPHQAYQQPPYQPPQPAQPYAAPVSIPAAYPPQEHAGYYDANGAWVSYSAPSVAPYAETQAYAAPMSEDGYDASHTHTRQSSMDFGLDFDFESEAGMAAEDIIPELSLGLIIWHPAHPTNTPLPSTFAEAEPEWLESNKAPDGKHGYAASEFFSSDKTRDISISVRQTDAWKEAQKDLIFVEFGETSESVPLVAVIANRDRPDLVSEQLEPVTGKVVQAEAGAAPAQPGQGLGIMQVEDDQSDGDQAMDMSDDEDEPVKPVVKPMTHPLPRPSVQAPPPLKQVNILDSLERALGPKEPHNPERRPSRVPARHSRSRSPEKRSRQGSQQPGFAPKAKPGPLPKDSAQESILAALGVEGSPKMVYPTPPPALGLPAPPGVRNKITPPGGFPPQAPSAMYQGFPYGPTLPPPPPPRESRSPSYDPWRSHDAPSPKSTTSQHTMLGSDFHPEDDTQVWDPDATPKAKAPQALDKEGSGRKRTFDEVMKSDERKRQEEDTPRARRRQQSRQDVYSRYRR